MSSGVLMMIMKLMVMMMRFDVYQRCSQEIEEKKFEGYLIGTFRKIMWGYDNLKKKKQW